MNMHEFNNARDLLSPFVEGSRKKVKGGFEDNPAGVADLYVNAALLGLAIIPITEGEDTAGTEPICAVIHAGASWAYLVPATQL